MNQNERYVIIPALRIYLDMSLFPKKNFIWFFDSIAPSKYLLKFRKLAVFEPFIGNDIANRGQLSITGAPIVSSLPHR